MARKKKRRSLGEYEFDPSRVRGKVRPITRSGAMEFSVTRHGSVYRSTVCVNKTGGYLKRERKCAHAGGPSPKRAFSHALVALAKKVRGIS